MPFQKQNLELAETRSAKYNISMLKCFRLGFVAVILELNRDPGPLPVWRVKCNEFQPLILGCGLAENCLCNSQRPDIKKNAFQPQLCRMNAANYCAAPQGSLTVKEME